MLHHCRKHEGRNKWYGKRVGHRIVVLIKGVFEDIQSQSLIQILEENLSHVVALADDDGILGTQLVKVGKGRTEHRVSAHVAESALFVPFLQSCLHRSDVADDAILRKHRKHLVECIEGVLHRGGIDDQLRTEFLDFLQLREAVAIVHETEFLGIHIEYGRLVLETQYVGKEGAHFAGS